jgi:hypothetical protein
VDKEEEEEGEALEESANPIRAQTLASLGPRGGLAARAAWAVKAERAVA